MQKIGYDRDRSSRAKDEETSRPIGRLAGEREQESRTRGGKGVYDKGLARDYGIFPI